MSAAIYDFNYYEIIQLHPHKRELPCLILTRHKLAHPLQGLTPDCGEQTECRTVNSILGLRQMEKKHHKPDSHNCVFQGGSGHFHPFHKVRFQGFAAMLQGKKQRRELCQTNSCPYKLQSKAHSSIFFVIAWWSCLPETNVIGNAYLSKQSYVSIYISGTILQLNFEA